MQETTPTLVISSAASQDDQGGLVATNTGQEENGVGGHADQHEQEPLQEPETCGRRLSTVEPDEDGIHLAPEPDGSGVSPCDKPPGCTLAAAERRSSFVQIEGRDRSRSVGEKQWTRVRAVMAWYTRLRRIKKSV